MSDSDDSVIINKHPFSVRRSDFDQKEVNNFNSFDRYAYDEDDSDKDSDDNHSSNSDDKNDKEAAHHDNRKRTSGLIVRAEIDRIDDIENDVEVVEVVTTDITESVILSSSKPQIDLDDECPLNSKVKSDLMSPVKDKQHSSEEHDSDSDD